MSNNLYGDSSTVSEIIPFPVRADVDNVFVDKVEFATSTTTEGKTYNTINIVYKRNTQDGTSILEQKVFAVDPTSDYFGGDDEKIAKAFAEFNTMMLHIASKFGVDKAEFDKETKSASFADFGTKFAALCNKYNKGQKMYMKVVRNSAGYPTVPRYPAFLQLMQDGVPCDLEYTKYEKEQLAKQKDAKSVNTGTTIQNSANGPATSLDDVMSL